MENTFYEYNAFLGFKVSSDADDYLNVSSSERVDFDVFLSKPAYFSYCFNESNGECSDFQMFSFAQDLSAAFCSIFVRMYLNIITEYFSNVTVKFV